jgi:hypothetical protein
MKTPAIRGEALTPMDNKLACWKDCCFPPWADGCPYLFTVGAACLYYGPNYRREEDDENGGTRGDRETN